MKFVILMELIERVILDVPLKTPIIAIARKYQDYSKYQNCTYKLILVGLKLIFGEDLAQKA